MTEAEELEILERFRKKAEAGQVVVVKDIKATCRITIDVRLEQDIQKR